MDPEADRFDFARGFSGEDSGDQAPWDRLREAHSSLPDLEFEIDCGGGKHAAVLTQNGPRFAHSDSELEQALNALGGETHRCLRAQRALARIDKAEWEKKPDWTLLLESDLELRAELARPWAPPFGRLRGAPPGEETRLLRELAFLPQPVRRRVAVTLVVDLLGDSTPAFRNRSARVCLRILDPDFQPDDDFFKRAYLSIVRPMMVEERP